MSYIDRGQILAVLNQHKKAIEKIAKGTVIFGVDDVTDGHSVSIRLERGEYPYPTGVAEFMLVGMPGCCGICVSTAASVHPRHQGKGLGTLLNKARQEIARNAGYGCLLCTDIEGSDNRGVLRRAGWTEVHSFINPRTDNKVLLSVVDLRPDYMPDEDRDEEED